MQVTNRGSQAHAAHLHPEALNQDQPTNEEAQANQELTVEEEKQVQELKKRDREDRSYPSIPSSSKD